MSRLQGHRLGTWSLRLDAAYCLILGVLIAATAPLISTVVRLPGPVLMATGIVVALWACAVAWMTSRLRLESALRFVMAVNIVAAVLIAAASSVAVGSLVVLVVLAIAVEVFLFAVSQAVAVRAIRAV
ncbi:hypothetical protein KZC51_12040 [Microbacterium sp. SSW1-49]|uniref:Histidine kinase n=1 Tax=Microbacterium croceum TaxID=2851645 RepID=A0ABT0FFL7_9MICO|nr:hypothetical protein [Microbacterium croceum]MCK2036866.1 hypothetical protein [Microbacterium croceum]